MTRFNLAGACLIASMIIGLTGCEKPDLSEMMKPPPRPAELDKLVCWVGSWEGTMEMKIPGHDEVMTGSGTSTVTWEADKWLLLERFEGTMGDEGTMKGLGVWTWDPKAHKYRVWSFDTFGGVSEGTATYDEETSTWHMKAKSRYLASGQKSVSEGKVKMLDNDTMEWDFTEWDSLKLSKYMEGHGTSRRK